MIDNLAIFLTHSLMLLAAWRLLARRDLDAEGEPEKPGFRRRTGANRRA